MDSRENTIIINNSNSDFLKSLNKQSKNTEEFLGGLNKTIERLKNFKEMIIVKSEKEIFSINKNKADEIIKELEEVIKVLEDIKNSKEEVENITLPLVKQQELEKDYDGDGLTNKEEIVLGRNIMINENVEDREEEKILFSKEGIEKNVGEIIGEVVR